MDSSQKTHRPTSFKQTNKEHKHGRHRSKGAIELSTKGKVNVKTLTKTKNDFSNKNARRNQANQLRAKKREEVLNKKRQLGTASSAPFLISIVPLSSDVDIEQLLKSLKEADPQSTIETSDEGHLHISVPRFKQKFSFIIPIAGDIFSNLDALKISNTVIFVMSAIAESVMDNFGKELLTAICAQGLPTSITVMTELESVPIKKRNSFKETNEKLIQKWIPEEKIFNLEKISDGLTIFRKIGTQKQKSIFFRDKRPHMVAEEAHFDNDILKVTGFIRGQDLSVNSLVHIPGWGDFQLSEIHTAEFKYGALTRKSDKDTKSILLAKADPELQASLQSENIPDPLEGEQTWPTESELEMAEQEKKFRLKKNPKGMSEYQAAWLSDEESDDDDDDSEDDDYDNQIDMPVYQEPMEEDIDDAPEYDTVTVTDVFPNDERYDDKIDYDEEEELLKKLKAASDDAKWPDETDIPFDMQARNRFQRYRGLASFRTSPWDPMENLPLDYDRIYRIKHFNTIRRRIFKQPETGISTGSYVTVYIKNVPKHLFDSRPKGQPIVLFGMLLHEQRMSVMNIFLNRPLNDDFQQPIKSKEQIIFHCGFRRYQAAPIFSQHTNGNKFKFERYFQPNTGVVATMFAPITIPPCNVLAFQQKENGKHKLIATGSVLSADANRVNIKRVCIAGHPFKIHKKSAVVRFMFTNKEDIEYFKSIELNTRFGRRGHIKESLGTHGHMKCQFDGPLKSEDTVYLTLYKRVFPKWTYEPYVSRPLNMYSDLMNL